MFNKENRSIRLTIVGLALAITSGAPLCATAMPVSDPGRSKMQQARPEPEQPAIVTPEVLVIRSTGAVARQHPRGSRLANATELVLARGDSVYVLTSDGTTRRFIGPGQFSVNGARRVASTSLGLATGVRTVPRTATSRLTSEPSDDEGEKSKPLGRSVWHIDLDRGGTFCVVQDRRIALWRADATQRATVAILNSQARRMETIRLLEAQHDHYWAPFMPIENGQEYEITTGDTTINIVFASITADIEDQVDLGSAFIANGCDQQIDLLIQDAPNEDSDSPTG